MRSIRIFVGVVLLAAWAPALFAIDAAPAFQDPALQARYQHLTRELRCLVCQNETIADSNAELAAELRGQLRDLLAQGKSDDEVLKFLTARYGDFVLYDPPFVARTWILWSAPAIALGAGVLIAVVVIRRRAKMPIDADAVESDIESDSAERGAGAL